MKNVAKNIAKSVVTSSIRAGSHWLLDSVKKKLKQPHVYQKRILFDRLRSSADSRFGRDHGLQKIRSVAQFRSQLKVSSYDDFKPYIDDVRRGDVGALFSPQEKVLMFTLTSGTTGQSKPIPITASWLRAFRQSWRTWGMQAYYDHASMFHQHILAIAGSCNVDDGESAFPTVTASGLCAVCQNSFVRRYYVIPPEVSQVSDAHAKNYLTLRLALPVNIGLLSAATPAAVIRLAQIGDQYKEQLIRDIAGGELSKEFDIPDSVRAALDRRISQPNVKRARELEAICDQTGSLLPRDYWNMSLIGCWLGGTVGQQSHRIAQYYGDVDRRDIGYLASEGRFSIPLSDHQTSGVLDVLSNYYEFIPVDEIDSTHPTILECHELLEDQDYFVLLTTASGLFRYNICDVVRCTGFVGATPLIEFVNKGQRISDLEGEKLSEHFVVQTVARLSHEFGIDLDFFSVIPIRGETEAYYQLAIESNAVKPSLTSQVVLRFDQLLRANFAYDVRRSEDLLGSPRLQQVPLGTWDRLRFENTQLRGMGDDRYKHPYLMMDQNMAGQLAALTNVKSTAA